MYVKTQSLNHRNCKTVAAVQMCFHIKMKMFYAFLHFISVSFYMKPLYKN